MAPSIIYNNTARGDVFLPGQIFVFGGFALRANSLGHLEQIDSYASGHQVRFGSLNYVADIHGDLIFDGSSTRQVRRTVMMGMTFICHRTVFGKSHPDWRRVSTRSRSCLLRTGGWTPPRRPYTHRRWRQTPNQPEGVLDWGVSG